MIITHKKKKEQTQIKKQFTYYNINIYYNICLYNTSDGNNINYYNILIRTFCFIRQL